jgi:hypothetical protein
MNDRAMYHTPTRRERFWRWAGFVYIRTDLPDDIDLTHPGWMITTALFKFTFWDRVRLLVSGDLHVEIRQATTQHVDESVNAISHHIRPPKSDIF